MLESARQLLPPFKELAMGAPTYNVRDGWDEITEMVAEGAFACNEESQRSNPVDK